MCTVSVRCIIPHPPFFILFYFKTTQALVCCRGGVVGGMAASPTESCVVFAETPETSTASQMSSSCLVGFHYVILRRSCTGRISHLFCSLSWSMQMPSIHVLSRLLGWRRSLADCLWVILGRSQARPSVGLFLHASTASVGPLHPWNIFWVTFWLFLQSIPLCHCFGCGARWHASRVRLRNSWKSMPLNGGPLSFACINDSGWGVVCQHISLPVVSVIVHPYRICGAVGAEKVNSQFGPRNIRYVVWSECLFLLSHLGGIAVGTAVDEVLIVISNTWPKNCFTSPSVAGFANTMPNMILFFK